MYKNNDIGYKIRQCLSKNVPFPDNIIIKIIQNEYDRLSSKRKIIFESFPFSLTQAIWFVNNVKVNHVYYFKTSLKQILYRSVTRRVCSSCSHVTNIRFDKLARSGKCSACGGILITRPTDTPNAIVNRYRIYEQDAAAAIDYLLEAKKLEVINGNKNPQKLYLTIAAVLK
jgi:adenylate kinase